jgi:hypothetical protein
MENQSRLTWKRTNTDRRPRASRKVVALRLAARADHLAASGDFNGTRRLSFVASAGIAGFTPSLSFPFYAFLHTAAEIRK